MSPLSNVRVIRCDERERLPDAMQSMFQEDSLCDVTICCDGQLVKSHRVILAASSSYFMEIFSTFLPAGQQPVVFVKSIPILDLMTILEYIYKGEVTVEHSRVESLKSSAATLGVAGFVRNAECDYDDDVDWYAQVADSQVGTLLSQNHLPKGSVQKSQENRKPNLKIMNSKTKTFSTSSASSDCSDFSVGFNPLFEIAKSSSASTTTTSSVASISSYRCDIPGGSGSNPIVVARGPKGQNSGVPSKQAISGMVQTVSQTHEEQLKLLKIRLFPKVHLQLFFRNSSEFTSKIIDMLLEMEMNEIVHLLDDAKLLMDKVDEGLAVLEANNRNARIISWIESNNRYITSKCHKFHY